MTSNRAHILNQVAAGDLSPEEAAERLRGAPAAGPAREGRGVAAGMRWLRIRVTNLATGRAKVNVNVPLSWVAAGLRFGTQFAPQIGGVDLESLLADIEAGTSGRLIDVEDYDDGERVEIYVE